MMILIVIAATLWADMPTMGVPGSAHDPDLIRGISFHYEDSRITIRERKSRGWTLEVSDKPVMIRATGTHHALVSGEWRISEAEAIDICTARSLFVKSPTEAGFVDLLTMYTIRRWYETGGDSWLVID